MFMASSELFSFQLPFKLTVTHFTLIFTSSLNIRLTDTLKKFIYIVFDYNNLEYFCAMKILERKLFLNVKKKANYFEICDTTVTLQLSLFHNNHYPILVFLVMCYLSLLLIIPFSRSYIIVKDSQRYLSSSTDALVVSILV